MRLVLGFNDLVFKLLAEKLRTFGSNILKFLFGWEELSTIIRKIFILASKSSYIKAEECAMRKPLRKRKQVGNSPISKLT